MNKIKSEKRAVQETPGQVKRDQAILGEVEKFLRNLGEHFPEVFQTPSFPFCTILKTENLELKNFEFSLRFTQTTILLIALCNKKPLGLCLLGDRLLV